MMSDLQIDQRVIVNDGGGGPRYIWPFPTKDLRQYPQGQVSRIDQGFDMGMPDADCLAIAAGTISMAHDTNNPPGTGFGNKYPLLILDTPDDKGYSVVYYGHTVGTMAAGKHVNQGDIIATTKQGPQGNATGLNGWLEIGWWKMGSGPEGPLLHGSNVSTQAGQDMHDALIGAPTFDGKSGGNPGSGNGGNGKKDDSGKGKGNNDSQIGKPGKPADNNIQIQNLKDPRDNRPFHPFFSLTGQPTSNYMKSRGKQGLVRGGMFELMISDTYAPGKGLNAQSRQGGQFACFFMMNPSSISVSCAFDPSVAPPSTVDPAALAQIPYWMQNQTISWSIIFNRQYEVWQGGVVNPWTGGPGPSDIGVRWDIRALERLMGVYDSTVDTSFGIASGVGVGTYGPGSRPPSAIPIQVVFGGPNSYQFQGSIASFDYTYTLFDINMIPVEAQVDISVMRQYLPMLSNADVVTNWTGVNGTYHGGSAGHVGGGGPGYYASKTQPSQFNSNYSVGLNSKMYQP